MTALNHTASYVPATHIEAECAGCRAALVVPVNAAGYIDGVQYCRRCQHVQQDMEAGRIATEIRDLAAGNHPYDLLTVEDRRVHLSQLAVCVEHARKVTLGVKPVAVAPAVQAVAYAHYASTAADEPSHAEKAAIYEAEENVAREEAVANDWR